MPGSLGKGQVCWGRGAWVGEGWGGEGQGAPCGAGSGDCGHFHHKEGRRRSLVSICLRSPAFAASQGGGRCARPLLPIFGGAAGAAPGRGSHVEGK